jgi:hypothetical protein
VQKVLRNSGLAAIDYIRFYYDFIAEWREVFYIYIFS